MPETLDYRPWGECPALTPFQIVCLVLNIHPLALDGQEIARPAGANVGEREWTSKVTALLEPLRSMRAAGVFAAYDEGRIDTSQALKWLLRAGKIDRAHPLIDATVAAIENGLVKDKGKLLHELERPITPLVGTSVLEEKGPQGKHNLRRTQQVLSVALRELVKHGPEAFTNRKGEFSPSKLAESVKGKPGTPVLTLDTITRHVRDAVRSHVPLEADDGD